MVASEYLVSTILYIVIICSMHRYTVHDTTIVVHDTTIIIHGTSIVVHDPTIVIHDKTIVVHDTINHKLLFFLVYAQLALGKQSFWMIINNRIKVE